jgi:hypothetical protein
MWDQASLHKWLGQHRRNWESCYSLLSGALGDGMINGKPMSDVLHIMEPFNLAQSIARGHVRDLGGNLAAQLERVCQGHARAHRLACDVRTLTQWLGHDILASPDLATRMEPFDFVVRELRQREPQDGRRIRRVRVALQNQRDDLLAFAGVLDARLAAIAQTHAVAEPLVRAASVHSEPEMREAQALSQTPQFHRETSCRPPDSARPCCPKNAFGEPTPPANQSSRPVRNPLNRTLRRPWRRARERFDAAARAVGIFDPVAIEPKRTGCHAVRAVARIDCARVSAMQKFV